MKVRHQKKLYTAFTLTLGKIWHHCAMGLVHEKRPVQYRSYHDTRRWVMDLSRRHDGSIGIAGMTDRYDISVTDGLKDGIDYGTYFTTIRSTLWCDVACS